ncbi:unnamed protein product [Protopolystoma xenopodis]|uniref:Uncharacterized protein n=1 Tax=Protopolystoma xenopodis TaxID=117903 RepID=A0A3S5CH10_9PLAT|nr:unnamed protein product [Protopolystoma xenopodis]
MSTGLNPPTNGISSRRNSARPERTWKRSFDANFTDHCIDPISRPPASYPCALSCAPYSVGQAKAYGASRGQLVIRPQLAILPVADLLDAWPTTLRRPPVSPLPIDQAGLAQLAAPDGQKSLPGSLAAEVDPESEGLSSLTLQTTNGGNCNAASTELTRAPKQQTPLTPASGVDPVADIWIHPPSSSLFYSHVDAPMASFHDYSDSLDLIAAVKSAVASTTIVEHFRPEEMVLKIGRVPVAGPCSRTKGFNEPELKCNKNLLKNMAVEKKLPTSHHLNDFSTNPSSKQGSLTLCPTCWQTRDLLENAQYQNTSNTNNSAKHNIQHNHSSSQKSLFGEPISLKDYTLEPTYSSHSAYISQSSQQHVVRSSNVAAIDENMDSVINSNGTHKVTSSRAVYKTQDVNYGNLHQLQSSLKISRRSPISKISTIPLINESDSFPLGTDNFSRASIYSNTAVGPSLSSALGTKVSTSRSWSVLNFSSLPSLIRSMSSTPSGPFRQANYVSHRVPTLSTTIHSTSSGDLILNR